MTATAARSPEDLPAIDPVAAVLACLLPGAGHFFRGDRRRGGIICAGVLGLFFGGVFIGGIDAIDSRNDRLWFLGQVLVGPVALGTDWVHQNVFKGVDPNTFEVRSALPNEIKDSAGNLVAGPAGSRPPNRKSLGKMNEIGMLYATIAGMLNLIVIIDAAFPTARRKEGSP